MLPVEVLEEAARDLVDYKGTGMSVMEMSHRGKIYDGIIKQAEADFRELVGVPDNYRVLFLPVQECVRNHAAERIVRDHIQPHILGVVFKIRHAPEERFEPSRNVLFRFRARYALDRDQFLQDFKDSFFHIHIPL